MDFRTTPPTPLHVLPAPVRAAWRVVSAMPFENLSKIVKYHESDCDPAQAIRLPNEVLADHRRHGTGATYFALVFLFRHLLRRAGYAASLHSCDRRYGADTHAAATLTWQGTRWLFDPGFFVVQPIPEDGQAPFYTPRNPNASRIVRRGERRYACYTGHAGAWQFRFTFKDTSLSDTQFRETWARSFKAEMMGYPVLNRFVGGRMIYLQKSNLVIRDMQHGHVERLVMSDLRETIRDRYGIAPAFTNKALRLLR